MAGIIKVYHTSNWEGKISIGPDRFWRLVDYLKQCVSESSVLHSDPTFDPYRDTLAMKHLNLTLYSNAIAAEVARLLVEGSAPSHPFWLRWTPKFVPVAAG